MLKQQQTLVEYARSGAHACMANSALEGPAAGAAAAAAACRDCACVRTPAVCCKQRFTASCRACAARRGRRQRNARQAYRVTAAAGAEPCRLRHHRRRKRRRAQRRVQTGILHLSTSPPRLSQQPSRQHGHPGQHMQDWPLYTSWNHVTPPPAACGTTAAPPRPACPPSWCTAASQRMAVDWPRAGHCTVAG